MMEIKRVLSIVVLTIFITISFSVTANADENQTAIEGVEITNTVEHLKQLIFENEGVLINDEDIIGFDEKDGFIQLDIMTPTGFETYTFGLNETVPILGISPFSTKSIIGDVIRELIEIVKTVYKAGKYICASVRIIKGGNVCQRIGAAILRSMVPNVEYRAVATFLKSPNCVPYYSYHCSTAAGGAYWKTSVVRV